MQPGAVAVHRWFTRGEDWAMHPSFATHAVEVLHALDERIKGRQAGPFQVEASGGVLVGELLDDPTCLDRRAAGRRPCIVRLAYSEGPLSPPEQDRVLAYLRAMPLPESAGLDAALAVEMPKVRPLPRRATPEPKGQQGYGRWPLAAALLALLAVGAWLATRQGGNGEKKPIPPPPDGNGPPAKGLIEKFARIDHPYIAFLKKHPEALERPRRRGEASYEEWLARREFRDEAHPLPRRLREKVNAWRDPPEALAEAAMRMRAMRGKWPGFEEAPSLMDEVDAFFLAATRPDGLPPREEFDHPANAFLWRLPHDPIAAGRTFGDEPALRRALAELARRLGGTGEGDSSALLGEIERGLDYAAFRASERLRGAVHADGGEEPGPAVEAGLRRFAAGP